MNSGESKEKAGFWVHWDSQVYAWQVVFDMGWAGPLDLYVRKDKVQLPKLFKGIECNTPSIHCVDQVLC